MTPLEPDCDLERQIDRLVDGELSAPERRALLLRLDAEPGGQAWRRCALAFLEAQAWRDAILPACEPRQAEPIPRTEPIAATDTATLPVASRRRRVLPVWLRLAASLAAAFLLGWAVRGPSQTVVVTSPPPPSNLNVSAQMIARAGDPPAANQPDAPPSPADEPADGSEATEGDALASTIEAWQRRGFSVDERQRTLSVDLADGRSVTVPVSEFRLKFQGDRTY